jgi:hypothetical protein
MLVSREELEEAFTKVIEGKESFRSQAKLYVPKSTLHHFVAWLEKRVDIALRSYVKIFA